MTNTFHTNLSSANCQNSTSDFEEIRESLVENNFKMSSRDRLPLKIIANIAEILYIQECYVELESVIYTFPQLNGLFSHKLPTVVLVDDDQYEKYIHFILSRERSYGSKDLFIIKQKSSLKSNRKIRLKSKCYIILGSKCYQESILQEVTALGAFVTLVQNDSLKDMCHDKSYKCYELTYDHELENPNEMLRQPISLRYFCRYTPHVALLLNAFLKPIDPHFLRFEAYSGKSDLFFEWSELYDLYSSLINVRHNRTDDGEYINPLRRDRVINTPKCSFEFVKNIDKLTSLYQYSKCGEPDSLEWINSQTSSKSSFIKRLKKKLGKASTSVDTHQKIAFFNGLETMTVDKIISETSYSPSNNHIWIDCCKPAHSKPHTYQFSQRVQFLMASDIPRKKQKVEVLPKSQDFSSITSEDELEIKAGILVKRIYSPLYYIDLFYRDFLIEKLQSAYITGFNTSYPEVTSTENKRCLDDFGSTNRLDLKGLERKLNRIVNSMEEVRRLSDKFPQHGTACELLSQHIMTHIAQDIRKSIEPENLNRQQPLRLRVFDNLTHRINDGERYGYLKEWFHRKYSC